MRAWSLALVASLLLAGCATVADEPLDSDGDGLSDDEERALGTDPFVADTDLDGVLDGDEVAAGSDPLDRGLPPRVVVAVLDTAINPYHVHFQRNDTLSDEMLAQFVDVETGAIPERVFLAQNGTYEERREADEEFWDSIEEGKTYYFDGTSIIGVAHGGNLIDGGSHGTATSGAVLDANPDAIILFSQGFGGTSESWSAKQPWIDFMSESYGPLGSPPTWVVGGSSTADANKQKWDHGGIPVGAADNSPALAPIDSTAGPPWVVGVAGDHDNGCREESSGNVPDFTADFTQNLPRDRTIDEYGDTSGTSFATPMTAGVFSGVLLKVREAWGHADGIVAFQGDLAGHQDRVMAIGPMGAIQAATLDNDGLRHVMNMTATYYATEQCSGGVPVVPEQPWLSQGWGHIGPELIEAAAQCIIQNPHLHMADPEFMENPGACADKPDEAKQYMEQVHRARQQAWSLRG